VKAIQSSLDAVHCVELAIEITAARDDATRCERDEFRRRQ
jgi:hypothetical protein